MARKGAREIPRDERAALDPEGSRGGGTRCVYPNIIRTSQEYTTHELPRYGITTWYYIGSTDERPRK